VQLDAQGIQVSPLLKDLLEKDFLEGTVQSTVVINLAGDDPEKIKSTLNGKGNFLFKDGAIVGIDLAGMVRNVKATFGLAEKGGERPRTDFSELHAPFTITNGVVNTPGTSLMSPLVRVLAAGDADLVDETLDFRVEPKFVGTLKGQGDTVQRSGLMVPVLVTGTFSSPKFRPDLKGMLKRGLEEGLPQPSELKKILPGESMEEGESKPLEEQAKDLLKGLPFGR
jgi:AsmA protein